jgi:hypothetical protein
VKKRNLAFVFAAVIILAIAFAAIVREKSPPQLVVLPNGERYRFVAAVWGTRHIPPTMLARLSSRLPASATKWMPQRLANYLGPVPTFTLPQPCLYLWFRLEGTNASQQSSSLSGLLEEEHGVASGGESGRSTVSLGNVTWLTMTFPCFRDAVRLCSVACFRVQPMTGNPIVKLGSCDSRIRSLANTLNGSLRHHRRLCRRRKRRGMSVFG